MNEFVKKEPKKNVTIKVDPELLEKCREKNLNISKICRYALQQAIEGNLIERSKGKKSA